MGRPVSSGLAWRVKVLVLLAALAYLGFYLFGLVMGVFSPFAVVALSVIAAIAVAAIAAIWLRERLRSDPSPELEDAASRARFERERRGF